MSISCLGLTEGCRFVLGGFCGGGGGLCKKKEKTFIWCLGPKRNGADSFELVSAKADAEYVKKQRKFFFCLGLRGSAVEFVF